MSAHKAFGWLLVLLGALAVGLVAWEWQRTGAPPLGPLAAVAGLCAAAVVWPVTSARRVAAPDGIDPLGSPSRMCGDCGAPWNGYPRLSFCLRCGGTRTAASGAPVAASY